MSFLGPWEIFLLLIVLLLVFGPKRVPELGRSLGRGIREFTHSVKTPLDEVKAEFEPPKK